MNKKLALSICLIFLWGSVGVSQTHPSIFLTPKGVATIKASLGKYPVFDHSYQVAKQAADQAISDPIIVPIPKDGAGYTHETHKANYYAMYYAGIVYQITGEPKYAEFVRSMLKEYAELYPKLGLHPVVKSATPGKLFWQALNECVWLVHTSMAYDCVYDYINPSDRKKIEKDLFYPIAHFISEGNAENIKTFNKMHNHGTWATASVGLIGYVMGDKELVNKALYGSKKDGKSGFLEQMNQLFSPDGYFTEGAYYQRYAIWPFMLLAQAIELKQPGLKIFTRRDGILPKAVNTLLQSAYNGTIFHLNDALDKRYQTQEIVAALDIAYWANPADKSLLSIAKIQQNYALSDAGITTAQAVYEGLEQPFIFRSMLLRDGADGSKGGIAIFREGETSDRSCLVFKATSHGLSHGHYDKLTFSYYDNGNPVLVDYGAARFLNIDPKEGGRYTKENYTWAMQSIAHNTLTVDQKSHFDANIERSSQYASTINFCDYSLPNIQIVSACDHNAYADKKVQMHRTMAMITDSALEHPIVIDLMRVCAPERHTYDLPFYYNGQIISTSFSCKKRTNELTPLGNAYGYQHLWVEAMATTDQPMASFTWLKADRFYSVTTLSNRQSELYLTRAGANDPNMNIRNEPAFMIRQKEATNHTFASLIESHGLYDLNIELTKGFTSQFKSMQITYDDAHYTQFVAQTLKGKKITLTVVNQDFDSKKNRDITIHGTRYQWMGNFCYTIE